MARVQGTLTQLSFDVVNPEADEQDEEIIVPEPSLSTFKFTGELQSRVEQRYLKDQLKVVLFDKEGNVIATANAAVTAVTFPHHPETDKSAEWTERAHKIKLNAPQYAT